MRAPFLVFTASIASIIAVAACGARTSLLGDDQRLDPGTEPRDAGRDVVTDADDALDAPEDPDVIDPFPDAGVIDCPDASTTYIYLLSLEKELLRFYPPDLSVTTVGTLKCPTSAGTYSMGVSRAGVAYVLYSSGEIFLVSTRTASCKPSGFVRDSSRFPLTFGMGFSANADDPGEALFVARNELDSAGLSALARIDPATLKLSVVGSLNKPISSPELTGTSDARLFAFGQALPKSHLAEIDKTNAAVKSDVLIDLNQSETGSWAFAFWGGDFYFFTSDLAGASSIHRYTPGGSTTPPLVAKINHNIVGAGVSTCAPLE